MSLILTIMDITWQRCLTLDGDVDALYKFVIPESDRYDENFLLQRDPDLYQLYVVRDNGNLVALALVAYLEHVLHLDVIAVAPAYRGRGLSYRLWNELFEQVADPGHKGMTIESYPYNVEYFMKYGFQRTVDYQPIWTVSPTEWLYKPMRRQLTEEMPDMREAITDWQQYQRTFGPIGVLY